MNKNVCALFVKILKIELVVSIRPAVLWLDCEIFLEVRGFDLSYVINERIQYFIGGGISVESDVKLPVANGFPLIIYF